MKNGQYSIEEFERFARGIKKASDILKSRKPDFIFAPITGGIPFIDLLCILDRHFPLDNVEYPPNSSRFSDITNLMSKWYQNFLSLNYNGRNLSIVCLDEVVSGSSASRGYLQFEKAIYDFKKTKGESIDKKVFYHIIGIGEKPRGCVRNNNFLNIVRLKKANVVEVGKILTMDNSEFNTVILKIKGTNSQGRLRYSPEIEKFCVSDSYLTLLQNFASYFGTDPSKVTAQNLGKIKDSLEKYLRD